MSNVIDPSRQSWNKAEEERLRSALQAIPADHDLDSQIKVGFALNSLKSDDRWPRRALWDEWTAAIHAEPTEKEIDSFVQDYRGPPITVEVIYHLAKKWGWADPWASLNNIKARPAYLDSPGAASPSFAPSPTNGRPPVMLSALTPPQLTLADPFGPVAMTSPPLIDLEQARNFLAALAPGETEFTFQTFDDNKKRRREKLAKKIPDNLAKAINGSLAERFAKLSRLSADGAGVFVTVNRTDLEGRETKNIVGVRALFADLDGAPLSVIERLPPPHIITDSSPGRFHTYWLIEGIEVVEVNGVKTSEFTSLQERLIALFGSDPNVKDLPRVMRLPGFPHQKDPAKPYMVTFQATEGLTPYPVRTFRKALVAAERSVAAAPNGKMVKLPVGGDIGARPDHLSDYAGAEGAFPEVGNAPPDMGLGYSDGQRTSALTSRAGWCFSPAGKMNEAEAIAACLAWNKFNTPPLDDEKVRSTVASIWRTHLRNHKEAQKCAAKGGVEDASTPVNISDEAPFILPKAGVDFAGRRKTDANNALAFLDLYGENLRFVEKWKCWIVWDGVRWIEVSDLALLPLARQTTEEILRWAYTRPEGDSRNGWIKHAIATQSDAPLRAMINQAKGDRRMRIEPDALDADPWLLGCPNGTLDLRTGKLREARREDYITKQIRVAFDQAATCPRFREFLKWVTKDDSELAAFLQTFAGYSLTGEVCEEKMCVWFGGGDNGKTTAGMTLFDLMGDYAAKIRSDLLVHVQGKEGAPSPDVAALHGKRYVIASETDEGCLLSEAQIKDIVSNEPITARRLHRDPFTFRPTHKITLWTNHPPYVRGTDHGIWRRLAMVRFNAMIAEKAKVADFRERVLRPELPGILNWAVEGLMKWKRDGLSLPKSVRETTAEYRGEMDTVAQWLEERTEKDEASIVSVKTLHSDYALHLGTHTRPFGPRRFSEELGSKGYVACKKDGARARQGLKLKPPVGRGFS